MKTYGGVKVQRRRFITSTVNAGALSLSHHNVCNRNYFSIIRSGSSEDLRQWPVSYVGQAKSCLAFQEMARFPSNPKTDRDVQTITPLISFRGLINPSHKGLFLQVSWPEFCVYFSLTPHTLSPFPSYCISTKSVNYGALARITFRSSLF